MLWSIRQILVPCNYLRIRHGQTLMRSKAVFDFVLPALATAATCGACLWLGISLAVFQHSGLVKNLLSLLALMIVFYMAALAAVATFAREGMDTPLKGGEAILKVRHHDGGHMVSKSLTYRQFISYLFGYLSFLSLCLYVTVVFLAAGWEPLECKLLAANLNAWVLDWIVNPVLFVVVFFFTWQLIITSLLGIYFLTERVQTLSEPER
jgi:hypothetical protein